jgi:SAM-dependent methyltransferase
MQASSAFVKFHRDRICEFQARLLDSVVRVGASAALSDRAETFVGLFEKQLEPASRILDIGGRWGFYASPLERRGHRITVLDVVRPRFQQAPVVVYEGGRIPFGDGSFDACLCITVLHHIQDPVQLLREARRVTRGLVIVVEDLYRHVAGRIWTEWRDRLYNFEYFGHPCRFKKRMEWEQIFRDEGFRLVCETELYTWLCGLRILNGLFVLAKTGKGHETNLSDGRESSHAISPH